MEKTRLKGSKLEKRPGMKGSKEKNKRLGAWRKDRKHKACVKSMQRKSRTPSAWKRIESTKHPWKVCEED